jgi:hypothetical protein
VKKSIILADGKKAKIGDKVICIKPKSQVISYFNLTKGANYTITNIENEGLILTGHDANPKLNYKKNRFQLFRQETRISTKEKPMKKKKRIQDQEGSWKFKTSDVEAINYEDIASTLNDERKVVYGVIEGTSKNSFVIVHRRLIQKADVFEVKSFFGNFTHEKLNCGHYLFFLESSRIKKLIKVFKEINAMEWAKDNNKDINVLVRYHKL